MTDRTFIRELVSGPTKKKLVGLIIAKFDKRSFPDKKEYGMMKSQMTFTIRDSPGDFLNVFCWGSENFVANLSCSINIGTVVEISDFLVRAKSNNEYEEKYNPSTPSSFNISLSENYAQVSQYNGFDYDDILSLSSCPIRDDDDYYTLGDILCNSHNLNGSAVNILASVRDIGQLKEFTAKTGKNVTKREVILCDEYCQSFPLVIWDKEVALSVNEWPANTIVLFLVDVKVTFDEYRQKMVASTTSKTLITVNPGLVAMTNMHEEEVRRENNSVIITELFLVSSKTLPAHYLATNSIDTPQGNHLMLHAQNNVIQSNAYNDASNDNIDAINDIYTLEEMEEKLNSDSSMLSTPFCGIVYATVSHFDLDKDLQSYVIGRCTQCKRRVDPTTSQCTNALCTNQSNDSIMSSLEFRISLSDHTMGFDGFLLAKDVAEKTLQCNVDSFSMMNENSKTELKWKSLFERYKVYFKAFPAGQERQKPFLTILDMQSANDFMLTSS